MTVRVSVVIRCFNEEQHIGRLLAGIQEQDHRDREIIVVDSGSTDATLPIARRYPVRVVSIPPQEFSFGRSLNLGCAEASGDVIVIASAHVYPVCQDWLSRLASPFADAAVGLVYGRQRGSGGSKYSEQQIFRKWFPDAADADQKHAFCNNANAAIRRELWQLYPYDETLTGLEDLAWARQVKAHGHRIVYESAAEVVHVHDENWPRIYNRYRREAIAWRSIYPEEHFGALDLCRLLASNIVSDWFHAFHDGVLGYHLFPIVSFRSAQFLGTWSGHTRRGALSKELRQRFYYPHGLSRSGRGEDAGRDQRKVIDYSSIGAGDRVNDGAGRGQ